MISKDVQRSWHRCELSTSFKLGGFELGNNAVFWKGVDAMRFVKTFSRYIATAGAESSGHVFLDYLAAYSTIEVSDWDRLQSKGIELEP
jgi:hypothetical protein